MQVGVDRISVLLFPRVPSGGVEVCGLVADPTEEALHVFTLAQRVKVRVRLRQIVVGDVGVDGAMADGVDRDSLVAALALGDGVVVFDADA